MSGGLLSYGRNEKLSGRIKRIGRRVQMDFGVFSSYLSIPWYISVFRKVYIHSRHGETIWTRCLLSHCRDKWSRAQEISRMIGQQVMNRQLCWGFTFWTISSFSIVMKCFYLYVILRYIISSFSLGCGSDKTFPQFKIIRLTDNGNDY